jgi:hydrogenase expression/formation protein HypD
VTAARIARGDRRCIVCAYGDVLNVPTREGSLQDARRGGGDVRLVYGPPDAVWLATENPDRLVVFFSVGFETTAAPVAALAQAGMPDNFCLYTCHRYVPAAVEVIATQNQGSLAGFLLPGHASVVTGVAAYRFLPAMKTAAAVAGFEPADILLGLLCIARQVRDGRYDVENAYPRAVTEAGNARAQAALAEVFDRADASWRGIGALPGTGFVLRASYARLDALARLGIREAEADDLMPGCSCHLIMLGRRRPDECPLFRRACTPADPKGPCMVGSEGTCRAWYVHGGEQRVD